MRTEEFIEGDELKQKDTGFVKEVLRENLHRGRVLACVVIGIELLFIIVLVTSYFLKADGRFMFGHYLFMYCLMIAVNAIFLIVTQRGTKAGWSEEQFRKRNMIFTAYVLFMLSWGSVISLFDQKLYGQIMVYIVNVVICLMVFYISIKKLIFCCLVSSGILFAGLPFFQLSSDMIIGHYVNIFVFNVVCIFASRILYTGCYNNYKSKTRLKKANEELAMQIRENHQINLKLTQANSQLLKLSLLDELTGIPNRRSFRSYIDGVLVKQGGKPVPCSIIMIDIDYFKKYNDHYGHSEGDRILVKVAEQINASLRETSDFVARWGGEEFVYIALGESSKNAAQIAEVIRSRVSSLRIIPDSAKEEIRVTISLGVSTIPLKGREDIVQCLKHADTALYKAKSDGRNCVRTLNPEKECAMV